MPSAPSTDLIGHPVLRDVDGTPTPFQGRVEQVAVEEDHGALHAQGKVIGRGTHRVYARVARDQEMIALRPRLVRVIPT